MEGVEMITPTQLYNVLNQGTRFPALSNINYLLLLDARKKHEYNESHVICAKKAPKNNADEWSVPYDAELECKQYLVVYDGRTQSVKEESPAIEYASFLYKTGTRNPVRVLQGGYEDFSALYPFLRTQKILYMPREYDDIETYPIEIIPKLLYLGNWRQGNAAYIQKDLKIKAHVNCSNEDGTFYKEEGDSLLSVAVDDTEDADLHPSLGPACKFIDSQSERNNVVLVYSKLGISRSVAICLAYYMHRYNAPLQIAYKHVIHCCFNARPNRNFVEQLSQFEKELFTEIITDISDPKF